MKPIPTSHKTLIGFAATATLVALIAVGSAARQGTSFAQSDEVCGNDVIDAGEQCDDGNLSSGDGCSAYCLNESCGNAITDAGEQCDDGNDVGGDGCGSLCTIEFCGDQIVQSPETCDDGNNVSGDGCSSACAVETDVPLQADLTPDDTSSSAESNTQTETPAEVPQTPPPPPIPPRILQTSVDAATANTFFRTVEGAAYLDYLEPDLQTALLDILRALRDRRQLTDEQRELADQFIGDMGLAKFAERDRYNDMLARLIATSISETVISEAAIDQAKLTGDPTLIVEELRKVATPLPTVALRNETVALMSELQRQGLDIEGLSADDVAVLIADDKRPVELFEAVVNAKEKVEKLAVPDVDVAYQDILANAENLRVVLPVLEREYGIDREAVESHLIELETIAATATPKEAREVVDAINRLTVSIQRDRKIDRKTLETIDEQATTQYLQRFAQTVQQSPSLAASLTGGEAELATVEPGDLLRMTETLSRQAPLMQRKAFAGSDLEAQKDALEAYLKEQPDMSRLRSLLQEAGNPELARRELDLFEAIDRIGEIDVPGDPCDDSILAATDCVRAHTVWLENAARNRGWLPQIGGYLEDMGAVDLFEQYFGTN